MTYVTDIGLCDKVCQ